jgi:N-acyl-D-glutamate deacylase
MGPDNLTNAMRGDFAMKRNAWICWGLLWFVPASLPLASAQEFDVVIRGGRVIDPESGFDGVRNIGLRGGAIAEVTEQVIQGKSTVDAEGLIVAPGFVDLHAHGQCIAADRMQAFDGVTTTLELEAGTLPVSAWYAEQAASRRVLNYGTSAGWAHARVATFEGQLPGSGFRGLQAVFAKRRWVDNVANAEQVEQIAELLEQGLREGGIGIGCLAGYVPAYGYKEMLAVHQLAARHDAPTFTHIHHLGQIDPNSSLQAYGELISYAAATGARVHLCHFNSTSFRDIGAAAAMVRQAQRQGVRISVEAYPYGAGSTAIGSAFFTPENLARMGGSIADLEYKGEPLNDQTYQQLRRDNPGALVVHHYFRLPRDQALLDQAVLFPEGIIASDAMPWIDATTGEAIESDQWPLPKSATAHPRSASAFTRLLIDYVRDQPRMDLLEALRRGSYRPAEWLVSVCPEMARKGRLRIGADADLIVFSLADLCAPATFREPNQPTVGMRYVFVGGTAVIVDGALQREVFPGKAIRGAHRPGGG